MQVGWSKKGKKGRKTGEKKSCDESGQKSDHEKHVFTYFLKSLDKSTFFFEKNFLVKILYIKVKKKSGFWPEHFLGQKWPKMEVEMMPESWYEMLEKPWAMWTIADYVTFIFVMMVTAVVIFAVLKIMAWFLGKVGDRMDAILHKRIGTVDSPSDSNDGSDKS